MDATLDAAADSFLQRCALAGVAGHVSPESDLVTLDSRFPGLIPAWYRELLATKKIGDICFETEVEGLSWGGEGHIRDAATLLVEIEGANPDQKLADHGYLAIGAAGDGDCWVVRATPAQPTQSIYFRRLPMALGHLKTIQRACFHTALPSLIFSVGSNPLTNEERTRRGWPIRYRREIEIQMTILTFNLVAKARPR